MFKKTKSIRLNFIEILPSNNGLKWEISFLEEKYYSPEYKTGPNSLGFYWYNSKIGKQKAFDELKCVMIKHHSKKIKRLIKSLEALTKLKLTTDKT